MPGPSVEDIRRARSIVERERDRRALSWPQFAGMLGEEHHGNLHGWIHANPKRPGVPRRALVFAAFALEIPDEERLLLLRVAGVDGLLAVARASHGSDPDAPGYERVAGEVSRLAERLARDVFVPGSLLERAGLDADSVGDWDFARTLYFAAEASYGRASSNAPRAALRAADVDLKLGDYAALDTTMKRIDQDYAAVSDPLTRAQYSLLAAHVALHRERYVDAVRYARVALGVGQRYREQRLGDAWHLLGRAYHALAEHCPPGRERLLALAEDALAKSLQHHQERGTASQVGYDLLRLAELPGARGQDEIRGARAVLAGRLGGFHLDLFDSVRALRRSARREAASRGLAAARRLRYRRGIAFALYALASAQAEERDPRARLDAADTYVAAALAHPLPGSSFVDTTIDELDALFFDLRAALPANVVHDWAEGLADRAASGDGPLSAWSPARPGGANAAPEVLSRSRAAARHLDVATARPELPGCPKNVATCDVCLVAR